MSVDAVWAVRCDRPKCRAIAYVSAPSASLARLCLRDDDGWSVSDERDLCPNFHGDPGEPVVGVSPLVWGDLTDDEWTAFADGAGFDPDGTECRGCYGPPAADGVVHRFECPRHPRYFRDAPIEGAQ